MGSHTDASCPTFYNKCGRQAGQVLPLVPLASCRPSGEASASKRLSGGSKWRRAPLGAAQTTRLPLTPLLATKWATTARPRDRIFSRHQPPASGLRICLCEGNRSRNHGARPSRGELAARLQVDWRPALQAHRITYSPKSAESGAAACCWPPAVSPGARRIGVRAFRRKRLLE